MVVVLINRGGIKYTKNNYLAVTSIHSVYMVWPPEVIESLISKEHCGWCSLKNAIYSIKSGQTN